MRLPPDFAAHGVDPKNRDPALRVQEFPPY